MTRAFISIRKIERTSANGKVEELALAIGVNLLIGAPNTGKTKWLQTLDYLLGDSGENPFAEEKDSDLAEKYVAAALELTIGLDQFRIERRWNELGAKSKVFVGDISMTTKEFQRFLMEKLGIPVLHFPKGNPYSGQTWPELSFRTLLRHIFRQQRFWSGLVDRQSEDEQRASVLQFLGLAEGIYTPELGEVVRLTREIERLRARRDQYNDTLSELARDLLGDKNITVSLTSASIDAATARVEREMTALQSKRNGVLSDSAGEALQSESRDHVSRLADRRARTLREYENERERLEAGQDRLQELVRYKTSLADELQRIERADDASEVLSDLRVTHCPACDQAVSSKAVDEAHCFLCHQGITTDELPKELAGARIRYEKDRLKAELIEAADLVDVVKKEVDKHTSAVRTARESLQGIEDELTPARAAVGALAQTQMSGIDNALGRLSEQMRQISRVKTALGLGTKLEERIRDAEDELAPIKSRVDELASALDFGMRASWLEDGMNDYLNAINAIRSKSWRHSPVTVRLTKSSFSIRVGEKRWQSVLGGTDSLYFLMAYQYGLLSLSARDETHYPGLAIIDIPGEFSGEAVGDAENFVVSPFIDLLNQESFEAAQVIITGAAFDGLSGGNSIRLSHVYLS